MSPAAAGAVGEELIVVLAPVGRDAELLVRSMEQHGLRARALRDEAELMEVARTGRVGTLVVTAEALSTGAIRALGAVLEEQPLWSGLPVLMLVPGGGESRAIGKMEEMLRVLPNVTLLERPIRPATLLSAAQAALRSRRRQYASRQVIEERDRAAATLIESEKLAAVGRLAASIAHEINNPLEAVTNLLYLIEQDEHLRGETKEYAALAAAELRRAAHITQQSLRFHRQSTRARPVTARELMEPILGIFQGRLSNCGVEMRCEFKDETRVMCFEGEIRQVLSNLIGNAIDAMKTGGRLVVRSQEATDWTTGRQGLSVTVCDSGHGMSAAVQARIFEAFYSTKGIGGTGLGLWISAEILQKHQGRIAVRSREAVEAGGTVFRVFLPVDSEPNTCETQSR